MFYCQRLRVMCDLGDLFVPLNAFEDKEQENDEDPAGRKNQLNAIERNLLPE